MCQWLINLLNIGDRQPRPRGRRPCSPSPAIDIVGRGIIGPRPPRRWRSRVRGLPEFGGELPVGRAARGDRSRRARAGSGRWSRSPATRCSPRPMAAASTPRWRARLHGRDRHLPQRDDPARRPDPAADLGARARPLRPGLPRLAVRNTARFTPALLRAGPTTRARLADLRALAERTLARLGAGLKDRLARTRARSRASPARSSPGCCATGDRTSRCGLRARPRRGWTSARCARLHARAAADPTTSGSTWRPRSCSPTSTASARRPSPAPVGRASCCSSAAGTSRTATPGCTTPSGSPAGKPRHQLLMHPDDLADRGARGRRDGPGHAHASAAWTSRCRGTDDMMPGVVSLPHGYGHGRRHPDAARRDRVRGLDQRPDRPRAAGRLRQRRAQRRSRDGPTLPDARPDDTGPGRPSRPTGRRRRGGRASDADDVEDREHVVRCVAGRAGAHDLRGR